MSTEIPEGRPQVNLRIPETLLERVDEYAYQHYISRNAIIVQAVIEFLNRRVPETRTSIIETPLSEEQ